jgi:hypothetical protein
MPPSWAQRGWSHRYGSLVSHRPGHTGPTGPPPDTTATPARRAYDARLRPIVVVNDQSDLIMAMSMIFFWCCSIAPLPDQVI